MSEADRLAEQPSKSQNLKQDQSVSDLEAVLRMPQGRRVLLRLLERCGLYRTAYTGETQATNLRLGEQNIGLWLVSQMEMVGSTEYPRLLLEAAQRQDLEGEDVHVLDAEQE